MTAPTLLGHVGAVSGSAVSIRQFEGVASGISIIGGRSYRVGQVGSFVRIPQGYHDLYGIIAEVGATATPEALRDLSARGERWMTVQLVGEIVETAFERGISQYPAINDEVHLVTDDDLAKIYGTAERGQVVIGRLAGAESIPVRIDLDRLVTRHSAVLGSTGAGKSTTIASLLRAIAHTPNGRPAFPSTRILLLDIHGEYANALKHVAKVFRVSPGQDEEPLHIPYWAIDTTDLMSFLMGRFDDRAFTSISDRILAAKLAAAQTGKHEGTDINSLTAESPLPFSLKQLWLDLIDPEVKTWSNMDRTVPALETAGDADKLVAPKYRPAGPGSSPPFLNNVGVLSIRRQLDQMRSRLLDRQYDFMLHPGPWEPSLTGNAKKDLPELLEGWLGSEKPISILDLSGVPSMVLHHLVGGILNILYEALFWGRETEEGGRKRPLLVVMEEAHHYLGKDSNGPAKNMVQRIVKEGRKFGVGAMIVSQRPSEIDDTILSQCGTFIALRLSNAGDRSKVQAALPDSLSGLMDSLPVLRTGEAIIAGEAAKLPIRCRITESFAAPLIAATKRECEKKIAEKDNALDKCEAELRRQQNVVKEAQANVEERVAEGLRAGRDAIAAEESRKAKLQLGADLDAKAREIADLKDVLLRRDEKLSEAQAAQVELLRKQRELDDARRELELSVEKRVQEALGFVRDQAKKEAEDGLRLKVSEKEEQILSMQRQIEELRRRAEQGSQQLQGEVLELQLETLLGSRFPLDILEPVAKGEFGGDVLHRVVGPTGQVCGTILWETKRTKNWSDSWLSKLRGDQRSAKAELALLISEALPKGVESFEQIEGVWVTHPRFAIPVASVLRQSLIELAAARLSQEGGQTKAEQVYQYLMGPRFRHRVEAIVEKFSEMQGDLNRERKATMRLWAKREVQIQGVIDTTVGMYGDLQGIAGRAMQEIPALETPLIEATDDDTKAS